MADDDTQVQALAGEIAAHLRANPHAADTLDGVCAWWLGDSRRTASREEVQRALDRLIVLGVVRREALAGGETVYSGAGNGDADT